MNTTELVAHAIQIERLLTESNGELDPLLEAAITDLGKDIDAVSEVSARLDWAAQYWKAKAEKATAIAKALAGVEKRLKDNLKAGMVASGMKELRGQDTRFVLTECAKKLVIDDSKIPDKYRVAVYVPDKPRIKEALSIGKEIEGASLEGGYQLREYANRQVGTRVLPE